MDAFERLTHAAQWRVMMAKLVSFKKAAGDEETSVCIELIDGSTPSNDINVGAELGRMGLVRYTGTSSTDGATTICNGKDSQEEDSWD